MLTVGTESCLGCWWWLRAVEVAVAARSHGLHLHRAACMTRRLQKLQVMRRPGCVHGTVHRLSRRARMSSKHFTLSDRMRECFLETCGLLQDMSFQKAAVAGVRFLWLAMRFCDGFLHMWAGLAPWLMHHPRR